LSKSAPSENEISSDERRHSNENNKDDIFSVISDLRFVEKFTQREKLLSAISKGQDSSDLTSKTNSNVNEAPAQSFPRSE
jgi:hypothetical protein